MMKQKFFRQTGFLPALSACALVLASCSGCAIEEEIIIDGGSPLDACLADMESGKGPKTYKEIGNFKVAEDAAKVDLSDADMVEEAYCANLLSIQKIVLDLGGIISLISSQLNAPYQPQLDARSILDSALGDIIKRLDFIGAISAKIVTAENVSFSNDSIPLNLDLSPLIDALNENEADTGGFIIPPSLDLDIGGDWGRVELHLLGGLSADLVGVLQILLAHKIKLDLGTVSLDEGSNISSAIAAIIAKNPELLPVDDGAKFTTALEQMKTALQLIAGEATGKAGETGMLASIEASLVASCAGSTQIICFEDGGATKGTLDKGDKIVIPPAKKIVDQVNAAQTDPEEKLDFDGSIAIDIDMTIFSGEDGIVNFVRAIKHNLEGKEATVPLRAYIKRVIDFIIAYEESTVVLDPALDAGTADWIAINPKGFFDSGVAGKGIRDYLPAWYAIDVVPDGANYKEAFSGDPITDGTVGNAVDILTNPDAVAWDFLIECELPYTADMYVDPATMTSAAGLATDSTWRALCGYSFASTEDVALFGKGNTETAGQISHKSLALGGVDAGHFNGQIIGAPLITATEYAKATTTAGFVFGAGVADVTAIAADGVLPGVAGASHDGNIYIGLQSPSIGGVLHVDPSGAGSFAEADNASLNKLLNIILSNYMDELDSAL